MVLDNNKTPPILHRQKAYMIEELNLNNELNFNDEEFANELNFEVNLDRSIPPFEENKHSDNSLKIDSNKNNKNIKIE